MYRLEYDFYPDAVEITKVLVLKDNEWVFVKDQELKTKIELRFTNSFSFPNKPGTGWVIYSENLSYITGGLKFLK